MAFFRKFFGLGDKTEITKEHKEPKEPKEPINTEPSKQLDQKDKAPKHPLFQHSGLMGIISGYIKPEPKEVHKFLQHVAFGEQDAAEAMLKEKPFLAVEKGDVTDYSGRQFKHITGFQYALWALDTHMWEMIRQNFPPDDMVEELNLKNDIKKQFEEVEQGLYKNELIYTIKPLDQRGQKTETKGEVREPHYDFKFVEALQEFVNYIDNKYKERYSSWWNVTAEDWDEADRIWQKVVGGAQRLMPAHVANWYCRQDMSFEKPDFSSKNKLPRNLKLHYGGVFFPLDQKLNFRLGFHFGIYRGVGAYEKVVDCISGCVVLARSREDLEAMAALCKTRYKDLEQLRAEIGLQQRPATRAR